MTADDIEAYCVRSLFDELVVSSISWANTFLCNTTTSSFAFYFGSAKSLFSAAFVVHRYDGILNSTAALQSL